MQQRGSQNNYFSATAAAGRCGHKEQLEAIKEK
jgi:hypothetical protein